jgi:outer membrane protein W
MTKQRKRLITLSLSLMLVFCFALGMQAQNKKKGIGFNIGYSILSEENFNSNMIAGLHFYYRFAKTFRFELRATFQNSTVQQSTGSFTNGDLMIIPLQLSVQYLFLPGGRFSPYVGGGAGYYLNNFKVDLEERWQAAGFELNDDLDNTFSFHVGGGFDYYLRPNLSFNADARYAFLDLSGTWSIRDQVSGIAASGEIDSNTGMIMWSIGVTYHF